ncbi:MAG: SGNH/GDSL hydrolase family protein [Promethearchaeota archaeon]
MTVEKIDLKMGLLGDDHVLSLFNIQTDDELRRKFKAIVPKEWADEIQFIVKNYGVAGDCTSDLLKRLKNGLIDRISNLDYVILIIGTNDVLLEVQIPEIVENMKNILSVLKNSEITPVFCTLFPISSQAYSHIIADINSIMTIYCANYNIPVMDLNLIFNNGNDLLEDFYDIGDGIHLTQEGYLFLADNLLLHMVNIIINEFSRYQDEICNDNA